MVHQMNEEELEILYFFRGGLKVEQISEATGHSVYRLKKLLANEPQFKKYEYIYRGLYEEIPDCKII